MKQRYLETGRIVSTHGIAGEVKILPWADDPADLLDFDTLYIDGQPYEVRGGRVHKGCVLVRFAGIDDVNAAMRLRDLVEQDEFDTGTRQLLNLGHTFGHGVEACSGYAVSHGKAVAIGMMMAARASSAAGLCPADVPPRLGALLARHGLPTATDYTADALREPLLSDKKRAGDTLNLVLPRAWGRSELCPVPVDQMALWIERGLSQ